MTSYKIEYPRRKAHPPGALNTDRCTDFQIVDIVNYRMVPCNAGSGTCVCKLYFSATYANNDVDSEFLTYSWDASLGNIVTPVDADYMELWVTSDVDVSFFVTLTMSDSDETSVMTKQFTTRHQ
jgi:hypothetical protein